MRLTLALLLLLVGAGYFYIRAEMPDVTPLIRGFAVVHYLPNEDDFEVTLVDKKPKTWVTLPEISRAAVGAILVSEDWAFYRHPGYDLDQIREAARESWEAGEIVRGASTITQQVARNVFLSQERTFTRKLREIYVAIQLEKVVRKRKILETYLNIAEWGPGVFGIGRAAQYYFGTTAAKLTAKEGAFLAMLLPSPKRYASSFRQRKLTDFAQKMIEDILFKMQQARMISEDQRMDELTSPLPFEAPALAGGSDA